MSRVFAIILSQYVLTGSAEQSTNTFLVAWTYRSLFAWPASPYRQFCFGFYRQLRFHQFICVWVKYVSLRCFIHFQSFYPRCAPTDSAEWPWTTTQKGLLHFLGVQDQSKFPFVCWYRFMSVWSSSGPIHQSPQLKRRHTFTPQQ